MATTILPVFYAFQWIPQDVLLPHLPATSGRTCVGNHATNHTSLHKVEFPIRILFVMSQDYQTRWSHTITCQLLV